MRLTFNKDFIEWANINLGASGLAKITQRWRKTGTAADGGNYKPYSKKNLVLRQSIFLNKGQEKQAYEEAQWFKTRGGKSMAYLPGGYKRLRDIAQLQTKHKDFNYTSAMIKTLRPIKDGGTATISTNPSSNGFTTIAGTDNPESQMKLKNLEKIEGKELLALTKKEEQDLQDILDKWITNKIDKTLNG
jgi:hypothetical protein